ncbi:MAG: hypothetical protein WC205_03665 [Opitutaceae bacterium]|jgi:hypothetical protein
MKTSVLRSLFVVLGFASSLVASAYADSLLLSSAAWDSQADGSSVSSPWSNQFGGGTTPAASTVTVTTFQSAKWADINNASTNEPVGNPTLQGNFTAFSSTTDRLSISFDYIIPSNYGNGSQIQFNLNQYISGVTTNALTIGLGRNYDHAGIYYVDSSGARQGVGHTFTAGEAVTISLTNISLASKTYDLSWSSSVVGTGSSGTIVGIALRNAGSISSFSYVSMGESSALSGTSEFYLRNFTATSVTSAIPETSTIGLVFGLVVLGGAFFRRCR